jgi:transposase
VTSLPGAAVRTDEEPKVHTDDTSWRIGARTGWLMVFCSLRLVVYQIRKQHRNDEVREILGELFAGILICDRGPSYDALNLRRVLPQKCLPHLIRNVTEVLPLLTGTARTAAEGLRDLLREALALWHAYHDGQTARTGATKAQELCGRADMALAPETHVNPILDRLVQGIGRQHDRGHVFRFLQDPTIPPTNNYGERTLRPPIIQRKISQCSRTEGGAEAQAAWSSVIGTLRALQGEDLLGDLLTCMRTGKLPGLEPPAPLPSGSPAAP